MFFQQISSSRIQSILLDQTRIVTKGQNLVVWINDSISIKIKISRKIVKQFLRKMLLIMNFIYRIHNSHAALWPVGKRYRAGGGTVQKASRAEQPRQAGNTEAYAQQHQPEHRGTRPTAQHGAQKVERVHQRPRERFGRDHAFQHRPFTRSRHTVRGGKCQKATNVVAENARRQ